MTAYDPKDDVDRLFACFKCGVSPPKSAFRERPLPQAKKSRGSPVSETAGSGGRSSSDVSTTPDAAADKSDLLVVVRDVVWATFPRQDEAIRYNDMDSKIRHHYEVIQEASPCHIYFDLEFDTRLNKKRDTDEMVDILIAVVFSALRDKYSIEGHEEWITELDSSTEEKFSRHLIIRIPKIAFKDNSHVGAFVCEVCSQIAAQRTTNHDLDKLYITKEISSGPVDRLFMDTAVYSRNRCFRLVFSSKSGKKSFLVPTKRFKCQELNDKDVFMESLICRLDDNCEKLLICKLDLECKKTLHFDSEISMSQIQGRSYRHRIATYQNDFSHAYTCGKSPFPPLDGFIESIASFGNVSGKIRSWFWFSQESLIIYNMLRSRYCENIGREHKGNHVFYIVDFQRAAYYQKCHDPDCRGYRSPLRPVPWDVIPELVESDQIEYQGHAMETNIENSSMSGKSITGAGAEDPEWWEQVVEFADSIENMDHSLATLEVKSDASIENMDHAPSLCASEENGCFEADPEWVMHAERAMEQYEEQSGGSQSHATSQVFDLEDV
ncbi:DNA primases [Zea mays]|uniref:DNA-directed primase/polymerase protein n=1 Tax=Zea mays TaxID=4577 RepID=A0A1D6IAG0_MAIZE|nr:DNA primases [Zea mays]